MGRAHMALRRDVPCGKRHEPCRPEAGSMLLEVTVFARGTWSARPIPIGNPGGDIARGQKPGL